MVSRRPFDYPWTNFMRTTQSLSTAFAVLLAAAGSIRAEEPQLPEGSRLLWNGDTEETSQLVQLGRIVDGGVRGKCLEAYWPDPPKRTNPVIVFGKSRPDIDLADYDELWFHAKASEPGKTFNVELRQWSGRIARLNVDPYLADGKLTTEWQLVRLPLAEFKPNEKWQGQVDHIVFPEAKRTNNNRQNRDLLPTKLYLDDFHLVRGRSKRVGRSGPQP